MRKTIIQLLLLVCPFVFTGCAASYKSIHADRLYYTPVKKDVALDVAYKYNVLESSGNKKYAKRQTKFNTRVVAIKITNNTDKPLTYGSDFNLYLNEGLLEPMSSSSVKAALRQRAELYLLYAPLAFLQFYRTESDERGYQETESTPIGLYITPPIMFGNMIVASTANTNFVSELDNNSLANKTIAPGQTEYVLIGINGPVGHIEARVR